jgi:outer membrane protein assembly factor BamB
MPPSAAGFRFALFVILFSGCRTRLLEENGPFVDGSNPTAAWPMEAHDARRTRRSELVGPATATVRWSVPIQNMSRISSPTIAQDGTIYVGAQDSQMHAFAPDGREKWTYHAAGMASAALLGSDGAICFGRLDGSAAQREGLYDLDADGQLRWALTGNDPGGVFTALGPPVRDGESIYAAMFDDLSELCALQPDGTRKWCTPISDNSFSSIFASPAIDENGNSYLGTVDKTLVAVDPSGKLRWRYSDEMSYPSSPAIGADGTLYFVTAAGLRALSLDGTERWFHAYAEGAGQASSPAIGPDGTIFFASMNHLHAVKPDGSPKWIVSIGGGSDTPANVAAPIVDAAGTVYFGSGDGRFSAFDAGGQIKWQVVADGPIVSSAAIGSDGTIFFPSRNSLYALGP